MSPKKTDLQHFMSPKEKKDFIGIKAVFHSFSGDFRTCYILKVLSTFLKCKTTQVAVLSGKHFLIQFFSIKIFQF